MQTIEGWNFPANIDNKITAFHIEKIQIACVVCCMVNCAPGTKTVETKIKATDFQISSA